MNGGTSEFYQKVIELLLKYIQPQSRGFNSEQKAPMRRYWWVNHNKTWGFEIDGCYLWSPKIEQGGAKSQFYENMRRATPGDVVLSFARGKISFVGNVTDFAISSSKPESFGSAGAAWGSDGWLLPMAWQALKDPVRPKAFIKEFAHLLPKKYFPIHPVSGKGSQKAYLAEISLDVLRIVLAKAGVDLDVAFSSIELASLFGDSTEQLDEAVARQLELSDALTTTERTQVILARRGQGQFRLNVQNYEKKCRVTGVGNLGLLIASHIKPWRSCENSLERLDGYNGLLLTPNVDLLFDRGLIAFEDNGTLRISERLASDELRKMGVTHHFNVGEFQPRQCMYLDFHRQNVFLK